jgi:hypothetical protein
MAENIDLRYQWNYHNDIPLALKPIPGEYERMLRYGWDKNGHPPKNTKAK